SGIGNTFIDVVLELHNVSTHPPSVDELNEEILQSFLTTIQKYTILFINLMERCVHEMFNLQIPIEQLLTPYSN
ncbi:unnamed protein product, partial [marine sediment metagenome]